MAASSSVALVQTDAERNNFPSAVMALSQESMSNQVDTFDEGHSVDAPTDGSKWEQLNEPPVDEPQETTEPPQLEVLNSSATEIEDSSDNANAYQASGDDKKKWGSTYSQKLDKEILHTSPQTDAEASQSNSRLLLSQSLGEHTIGKPNPYWVHSQFDRLVSDKKKFSKTTKEMREELKEIGLGDTISTPSKPKTVEDIMREYGLEPSFISSHSSNPIGTTKTAWTTSNKYSIINTSQNNETFGSEVDDPKARGSSVDDFSYLMRRQSSNSSFGGTTPRETANTYSESRNISKAPSLSYYETRNNPSATKVNSGSNIDKPEEPIISVNPSMFFQRERERLHRIDSVISRTPKNSYTNIQPRSTWELDNAYVPFKRTVSSRHSSFLDIDAVPSSGSFPEEEKDWGHSPPTRALIERQAKYPTSTYSQLKSQGNAIYQSSSSFSPTYTRKPYARSTPNNESKSTHSSSKQVRAEVNPPKSNTKQTTAYERATSKYMTKQQADGSRGSKITMKTKPRQSKSTASTTATSIKNKSLNDIDHKDFITRLMKNYSNSCVLADNDNMRFDSSMKYNLEDDCQELIDKIDGNYQMASDKVSQSTSNHRNEIKVKSGKYKPYQCSTMKDKLQSKIKSNIYSSETPHQTTAAWEDSIDARPYSYKDDSSHTGSVVSSVVSNRSLIEDKYLPMGNQENWRRNLNSSFARDEKNCAIGTDLLSVDSQSLFNNKEKTENNSYYSHSSHYDTTVDQDKGKSKSLKGSKSVPKKKPLKRK